MKKYMKYVSALALVTVALTGCDDYLDTMPDNRATLDTEDKIKAMLTSSYVENDYVLVAELSSDNTDNIGDNIPYTNRFYDQTYSWTDETESNNESLERFWSGAYIAIASANEALAAIETAAPSATIDECRGEALISRAYNHFMLACMFCQPWTQDAAGDLGLPYMEAPETELMPQYERGNLADFYKKIEADIEEGLRYLGDSHYTVPKYHFNVKAAYAFATRYYLYTEQWEKAINYANKCLGSQPKTMLRDWKSMASMTQSIEAISNEYISASSNANLLLLTAYSSMGVIWSNYYGTCNRYNHSQYLANNEDMSAQNIFGTGTTLWHAPKAYIGNTTRVIFWKYGNLFEFTDPVAQVGYRRAVYPAFTSDEALLNRAEAYIMLKRYDEAAADLTTWMQNFTKSTKTLTPDNIQEFYKPIGYCYDKDPKDDTDNGLRSTIKKHLNPAFAIDAEGSVQECMLQCMLQFRRLETMHAGIRWFDIKRYGIEIVRRTLNPAGQPETRTDFLGKDDLRRVHQIPQKVRDAGFEANPR